ncbi:MAG: hypothetical protein RI100_07395 [Nitrosarchaeum sp.]|jgi:hypothetical protein|uniref:hypothetical protein n=1 Tax=Nitrosarchaeum sp. TaxID=2026886 RepID=UPI002DEEF5EB|nr:hypothetical protein [Nitrosarchaeum sp.]
MRNFFRNTKEKSKLKSESKFDAGSEISVVRSSGGINQKESKMISITLKSKTETIDSLLGKIPGVI